MLISKVLAVSMDMFMLQVGLLQRPSLEQNSVKFILKAMLITDTMIAVEVM